MVGRMTIRQSEWGWAPTGEGGQWQNQRNLNYLFVGALTTFHTWTWWAYW